MKNATWMALIFALVGLASSQSIAKVNYQGVNTQFDEGLFTTYIGFDGPVDPDTVHVEFINQTIQLNIPDASIAKEKDLVRIDKNNIKSVYSYQRPDNVVRTRLIYQKPVKALDFRDSVRLAQEGHSLKIIVKDPGTSWAKELPQITPVDLNFELEKEVAKIVSPAEPASMIVAREMREPSVATEKAQLLPLKEKKKAKKKSEVAKKEQEPSEDRVVLGSSKFSKKDKNLSEAEIPVLTGEKKEIRGEKAAYSRMFMSLVIIALLGGGLVVFSKWWTKNNKKSLGSNQIRMITQHHLGPKKSLAIVRVAGEHILIGMTDHNVNLIKTLSLIDDEVPEAVPNNFSQSLAKADAVEAPKEEENDDEFAFGNIRESVNRKLREMRQI